ncbi:hypothetical protein P4O66_009170, partial [Electrophorus voltai]
MDPVMSKCAYCQPSSPLRSQRMPLPPNLGDVEKLSSLSLFLSMNSSATDVSHSSSLCCQIEDIITRLQDESEGVPIRTVKSFMSKIPSVVTGADIVQWLMKNLSIDDPVEALHIGGLIAAQGYIFPISDHVLTLKDDGTFYRFQAPYFWPSNCWEPENTDYGERRDLLAYIPEIFIMPTIYLCKRTMQNKTRLELADYEAENLARLQRAFARKWEFIFMQAEAQVKIDRKKDKTERKILDSQERAFWDVHRPVPGCVNTTEMDIRKCRRMKNPQRVKKSVYGLAEDTQTQSPVHTHLQHSRKDTKEDVEKEIFFLNTQLDRHCMKMSKVADTLMSYTEQYLEYDPFVCTSEPSNPWISDDCTFWELEASKDPSQQRVRKWGFSLDEALKDPVGRDQFLKFLESEFSSENLRFWLAVQDLKRRPLQDVAARAQGIWQEFLAEGAPSSINLDSQSYERTSHNLKDPGRYSFEDAQASHCLDHIYKLMKSDSYTRFLRSNAYQDLLLARKKPETEQGRRTSLEKFTRSVVGEIRINSDIPGTHGLERSGGLALAERCSPVRPCRSAPQCCFASSAGPVHALCRCQLSDPTYPKRGRETLSLPELHGGHCPAEGLVGRYQFAESATLAEGRFRYGLLFPPSDSRQHLSWYKKALNATVPKLRRNQFHRHWERAQKPSALAAPDGVLKPGRRRCGKASCEAGLAASPLGPTCTRKGRCCRPTGARLSRPPQSRE